MQWNWDDLRYFLALARGGTLSHAAEKLQVSHATVYRRIKKFETELNTCLFEKTPAGYLLTHPGAELLREVDKIEHAIEGVSRQFVGADQRIEGEVVIATTDSLGYRVLPRVIHKLKEAYPALKIDLRISNDLINMMKGEADIALRTTKRPPEGLVGRKICNVNFVACAASSYLRDQNISSFPLETDRHRFVMLGEQFTGIPFQKWLSEQIREQDDVTVANGMMAALELCRAGIGIAVLPQYLVEHDKDLTVLPTASPLPSNELWILTHKDLRHAARIVTTQQFIAAEIESIFAT